MATAAVETITSTSPSLLLGNKSRQEPQDRVGELSFCKDGPDGAKPTFQNMLDLNPDFIESRKVKIKDIRGAEKDYTLEKNGFEYVKSTGTFTLPKEDYEREERVKEVYYPELVECIKKALGASRVLIIGSIVRNQPRAPCKEDASNITKNKAPSTTAHVDTGLSYASESLKKEFPDQAEEILANHRWQLLNAWRPLEVVRKDPLAIADPRSIPEADLQEVTFEYPGRGLVPTLFLRAGSAEKQQWHYMSEQSPSDVLLFKTCDITEGAETRNSAHTSFQIPGTENLPPRESIETRLFAVY